MKREVLHVAESFGGGVAAAVEDYVCATPTFSHSLMYSTRPDAGLPRFPTGLSRSIELPEGHFSRIRAIRKEVSLGRYDLIHAHSSFAGAYVRMAVSRRRTPIVYTPHCYSFERRDISPIERGLYWVAEAALSLNTTAYAACSMREKRLSAWLGSKAEFVPNTAPRDVMERGELAEPSELARPSTDILRVVGAGRNSKQKDIGFFLDCIVELRRAGIAVDARWIGGDETLNRIANPYGVSVSGWVTREQALIAMSQADLYIHTARWEGFPIAVLEAIALGVATVVRDISAFEGVGIPKFSMPSELSHLISSSPRNHLPSLLKEARDSTADYTVNRQALALKSVYSYSVDGSMP